MTPDKIILNWFANLTTIGRSEWYLDMSKSLYNESEVYMTFSSIDAGEKNNITIEINAIARVQFKPSLDIVKAVDYSIYYNNYAVITGAETEYSPDFKHYIGVFAVITEYLKSLDFKNQEIGRTHLHNVIKTGENMTNDSQQ